MREPGASEWTYLWPDLRLAALGVDDDISGWMAAPGVESRLADAIRPVVWRDPHVQVLAGKDDVGDLEDLELVSLSPPGQLVGRAPLDDLVSRAEHRLGRTLLVRGPSGVGKSTVARRLATSAVGANGRLLQLPAEVMKEMTTRGLREVVSILRPDVLVIDDVPFGSDGPDLLTRLEIVRSRDLIVVLTQMTDPDDLDLAPAPGALYHPGMRPGRIDEIVTVPPPDESSRRAILEHYLGGPAPDLAVSTTEGLTGAYLKELAERIRTRGVEQLEQHVALLMAQAPVPHSARKASRRLVSVGR